MNSLQEVWRLPFPSQEMDDALEATLKYEKLTLSYRVEGVAASICFKGVAVMCFTNFNMCTKEHLDAYDRILLMGESEWLRKQKLAARERVDDLCHYRIFFDEVGCYDVIATLFEVH